ncbi:TniQ family protein [Paenibacillus elgii]|uniref:TniQ family protein n=1 Tax=Paenibacillus elgii TaxID=189691 RepID=UPI0030D81C66
MKKEKTKLLPWRPNMYLDESYEGYALRLSYENNSEIRDLKKFLSITSGGSSIKTLQKMIDILELVTGKDLKQTPKNSFHYLNENKMALSHPSSQKSRYCPICLKDKPYHRISWSISPVYYCSKHTVFLLDNCPQCNLTIRLADIVGAICGRCGYELHNFQSDPFEKIDDWIDIDWLGDRVDWLYSPIFDGLEIRDFYDLFRWLTYNIISFFPNSISTSVTVEQIQKYRYSNYFHDYPILHKVHCLSIKLLKKWPGNLHLFLHEQHDASAVKGFSRKFFYHCKNNTINQMLILTKEHLLRSRYPNEEAAQFDQVHISVRSVLYKLHLPEYDFKRWIETLDIPLIKHPHNFNENYLRVCDWQLLSKQNLDCILNPEFINLERTVGMWKRNTDSVKSLVIALDISRRLIITEVGYDRNQIIEHIPVVESLITLYEISQLTGWKGKSINRYLKSKGLVKKNNQSRSYHRQADSVYSRDEVLTILNSIPLDNKAYLTNRKATEILGFNPKNRKDINPIYFIGGYHNEPYYLKKEIESVTSRHEPLL